MFLESLWDLAEDRADCGGKGCQYVLNRKPALAYSKCKIKVATTVILTPQEGQIIRPVESGA